MRREAIIGKGMSESEDLEEARQPVYMVNWAPRPGATSGPETTWELLSYLENADEKLFDFENNAYSEALLAAGRNEQHHTISAKQFLWTEGALNAAGLTRKEKIVARRTCPKGNSGVCSAGDSGTKPHSKQCHDFTKGENARRNRMQRGLNIDVDIRKRAILFAALGTRSSKGRPTARAASKCTRRCCGESWKGTKGCKGGKSAKHHSAVCTRRKHNKNCHHSVGVLLEAGFLEA